MKSYITFVMTSILAIVAVAILAITVGVFVEYKALHGANQLAGQIFFGLVTATGVSVAICIILDAYRQLDRKINP